MQVHPHDCVVLASCRTMCVPGCAGLRSFQALEWRCVNCQMFLDVLYFIYLYICNPL